MSQENLFLGRCFHARCSPLAAAYDVSGKHGPRLCFIISVLTPRTKTLNGCENCQSLGPPVSSAGRRLEVGSVQAVPPPLPFPHSAWKPCFLPRRETSIQSARPCHTMSVCVLLDLLQLCGYVCGFVWGGGW